MDVQALLEKHKPVLVIFPQTPEERPQRKRPGALRPGRLGWGDYHPCPVEFFLHRVQQRDAPRGWSFNPLDLLPWRWKPSQRTGLDRLRKKVSQASPDATRQWELDVADMPSQYESLAWERYGLLLSEQEHSFEPVVYGRYVESDSGRALQYWYLYIYNDFRNNHEGDWEMVTIQVEDDDTPVRVAYSNHYGGLVRQWEHAPLNEPGGSRPLLYVARGSHAGYFNYDARGHRVIKLDWVSNPPPGLGWLVSAIHKIPGLRRWRDHPPADPITDSPREPRHTGIRLETALKIFPDGEPQADSEWWWLRLRCRWGSVHTRITGTIGVVSPWAGPEDDLRWRDPVGWMGGL